MRYDITSDACRICLKKSATCRSIFKPRDNDDMAPNIKLNLVAGVNVPEKDEIPGLPQFICKQCEISVNMAFNLRNKARKSDRILSVYCNKMNKDNIIVELANGRKFKLSKELTLKVVRKNAPPAFPSCKTPSMSVINFEENSFDEDLDDDDNVEVDNAEVDTPEVDKAEIEKDYDEQEDYHEQVAYSEKDDDYEQDNDQKQDDDHEQDDDQDECYNSEEDIKSISYSAANDDDGNEKGSAYENDKDNENAETKCTSVLKLETKRQPTYNGEEIAKKLKASNQYELVSWKQEDDSNAVPTFKLRLKEPEEKPLTKDFICDVCGNAYSQKHRLMEHMRRHNPDKIYACEICGKRFAVSEGLRRHILTHGALKPFKCNHCTRCFYTPSARKAHEKVHNGHKPFVCSVCTKAFAYTGSLRKHMLIHENKKLYRCEYCDKEFRLQHHMKQHEETQIHKDAVREFIKSAKPKDELIAEF